MFPVYPSYLLPRSPSPPLSLPLSSSSFPANDISYPHHSPSIVSQQDHSFLEVPTLVSDNDSSSFQNFFAGSTSSAPSSDLNASDASEFLSAGPSRYTHEPTDLWKHILNDVARFDVPPTPILSRPSSRNHIHSLLPPPRIRLPSPPGSPQVLTTTQRLKENYQWKRNPDTQKLSVLCECCSKWIPTGSRVENLGPLEAHQAGKACKRYRQARELSLASEARSSHFPPIPLLDSPSASVSINIGGSNVQPPTSQSPAAVQSCDGPSTSINVGQRYVFCKSTSPPANMSCSIANRISMTSTSDGPIECPGIELNWSPGHVYETYPWHRHQPGPGTLVYTVCHVSLDGQDFRVRSRQCTRQAGVAGDACTHCLSLPVVIEHLAKLATHSKPHTNHKFRTHAQLQELLKERDQTLNTIKLKVRSRDGHVIPCPLI